MHHTSKQLSKCLNFIFFGVTENEIFNVMALNEFSLWPQLLLFVIAIVTLLNKENAQIDIVRLKWH